MTRLRPLRAPLLVLAVAALIAALTIPALAADPSATPGATSAASQKPEGSAKPDKSAKPNKTDKEARGPKASKEPEVAVTLRGTIAATTDADGKTTYTVTADGKILKLEAGPSWFFGDKYPLKPFVGKTVTIVGSQRGDEVDVESVDGVALRAPGKPPWAGGWKAVGSIHPGWSQEKADRWAQKMADKAARGNGAGKAGATGCWPPGHCKNPAPESSAVPRGD
jgi:hypothetical protein